MVCNMEDILTNVIDIEGKSFFLVSTIDNYMFYAEENDPENFYVLKEITDEGEEYIVSLDDDNEYDKAMSLFYEKYEEAV